MDKPEIGEDEPDEIELELGTINVRIMEALESIAKSLKMLTEHPREMEMN